MRPDSPANFPQLSLISKIEAGFPAFALALFRRHPQNGKTMSLDGAAPSLDPAEEISTFCPVRMYLANRRFDGLLDTLDAKGGTFYVLTDGEAPRPGTRQREALEREDRAELAFGPPESELRIASRVRGMRIDEDGLFVYVGLDFLFEGESDRRRLDEYFASLW